MKKTRFEKFMLAVTKKALKEERLDTFTDHLKFVRLSIEVELLKFGGSEESAASESGTEKESRSRVDQVSGAFKKTGSALSWSWAGLKKIYVFLTTGNNVVIVFIGGLFLYAAIMMALEMV